MRTLFIISVIIAMLLSCNSIAQNTFSGKVVDAKTNQPIQYASVAVANTSNAVNTDSLGKFTLFIDGFPQTVIVSFVGYNSDTIVINSTSFITIKLSSIIQLKEVTIAEKNFTTLHSSFKTINTETIGAGELKKAACCNLSESFETNASVDVTMNDGVSGAKQLSMLGLDGVYTQVMIENIPFARALNSSYGLGFMPGTWIHSIDITKGSGTVVNGFEALSGSVNVELLKPDKADKLLLNVFGSTAGRAEANVNYQLKISDKWSYLLMAHKSNVFVINDFNKDGFIDLPLSKQHNLFNRVKYNGERLMFQGAVQVLEDNKEAGQIWGGILGFPDTYHIKINNRQAMFYTKTAVNFIGATYRSLGLITSGKLQEQHSFFGNKSYSAQYKSFFANLIYQDIITDTRHKYKTGTSYLYDQFSENYNDSAFARIDNMLGAFAEYEYDNLKNFSTLVGFRADNHPIYGMFYTPKVNLKFIPKKNSTIRLSAGMGSRISNVFMDNTGLFANSRKVQFLEKPLPEKGYSVGINVIERFKILGNQANIVVDVYHSGFTNQVVIDFYENYKNSYIYNLKGKSYANALQAEFASNITKFLTIKLAYKYYKVLSTYNGKTELKPMIPKSKALFTASYISKFDIWKIDASLRYTGISKLPIAKNYPTHANHNLMVQDFATVYAQITRAFKKLEVYVGCENIANTLQQNAIISADKPFADTFDATMVYGPTIGRVFYVGLRYNVK